jgi:hypothetical protein
VKFFAASISSNVGSLISSNSLSSSLTSSNFLFLEKSIRSIVKDNFSSLSFFIFNPVG